MRTTILCCLAIFISSCTSTNFTEWETELRGSGYDFRPYTDRGFLFTPESYLEPYDAVGLVEITYVPEIEEARTELRPPPIDGYRIISVNQTYYYVESPDTQRLIEEMYQISNDLGADALSNFQITSETLDNDGVDILTVRISGFAINRHQKE